MAAPGGLIRVDARDVKDLSRASKRARRLMVKELRKSNGQLARDVRNWARAAALSGTRAQQHAAPGIGSSSRTFSASLLVRATASAPEARPVFWGSNRRTGWNAQNTASAPQFPPWVGNTWQADRFPNEGPYVLRDVLAARRSEIEDRYMRGQWAAINRAFPSGRL